MQYLFFRTLSDGNGVNNGFDEPSLFLSKHWSKSQHVQPVNYQSQQPPFGRNNNNLESLKILTSELAENLGNGGGIINGTTGNNGINGSGNGSQRHHDSGYISPNFPPNSSNGSGGTGNGKAFFDGPNNPGGHQAVLEQHQPPVDPVLLQQVLQQQQQQQHPKQQPQQPMINHRPITGM